MNNIKVREKIAKSNLKKYQIAEKIGINCFTFSRWLQTEMTPERKARVMDAIAELKK